MAIPSTTTVHGSVIPAKASRDVTNKDFKIKGFSYPLVATPGSGDFSKSSGLILVKSMLTNLIKTQRGERFMLPDYGVNLRRFLMEPLDEATFGLIKEEITLSVRRHLKFLSLTKVQAFETRGGGINVKLFCSLKDAQANNFEVGVRI